ncbi:MAG: hypothetical protein WCJ66_17025 [Verrucomicrobiota bacterium]
MLAQWFGKPLAKLPRELRAIAMFHIPGWAVLSADERRNRAKEIDRQQATKFRIKHEKLGRAQGQARKDLQQQRDQIINWYDATLNANFYWKLSDVAPVDAATILCGQNPLDPKANPDTTTTGDGETTPEDYRRLLAFFQSVAATDKQSRTLVQWRSIARENGLKYHSWIDEYALAMPNDNASSAAPASPELGEEGVASKRPLQQQLFQEQEIVRVLRAAGYDPQALPNRAAGKPGAKADARGRLKFTKSVFDKAWERLRDSKEIKDAT